MRPFALTRAVSPSIDEAERTHIERVAIDYELAKLQHEGYEDALRALGCEVVALPSSVAFPDSVYIEDTAIVLDEVAIITRPGAESRRGEVSAVAEALRGYRSLERIEAPGTVDGGDVLRLGRLIYVGRSERTDDNGIAQLRRLVEPLGYQLEVLSIEKALHLKTAVTQVAENTLLVNRDWIDVRRFGDRSLVDVDPSEPLAANALLVGTTVIYPAEYAKTRQRLEAQGISVRAVPVSEMLKGEGGVTCCALLFDSE